MPHSLEQERNPQRPPRQTPRSTVAWFASEGSTRTQSLRANANPPRRHLRASHLPPSTAGRWALSQSMPQGKDPQRPPPPHSPCRLASLQSLARPWDLMHSPTLLAAELTECMLSSSCSCSSPSCVFLSSLLLGMTPSAGQGSSLTLWPEERSASSVAPGCRCPHLLFAMSRGPTSKGKAARPRREPPRFAGRVEQADTR